MGPCPDDATLAAYLERALFPEERARVEEHLARCSRCVAVVADSLAYLESTLPPEEPARPAWRPDRLLVAVLSVVVAAAVFIGAWSALRHRASDDGGARAALFAALGDRRASTARLTGGMPWSPPRDVVRGATSLGEADWRLAAAAERARELASASAAPRALGSLGAAHLLLGDPSAAIATLVRATAAAPEDARLRSDLAAAYEDRAPLGGGAADLAEALENASAALATDPHLAEARFNRALALEGLGLRRAALAAWRELLRAEPDPGWAAEARRHVAGLSAPPPASDAAATDAELRARAERGEPEVAVLVGRHPAGALALMDEQLLPRWARAVSAGDEIAANRVAAAASAVAAAFARSTGDRALAATADRLGAAAGTERRRLAEGLLALQAGTALRERMRLADARPALERAAILLSGDAALARRAQVEILACDFYGPPGSRRTIARDLERVLTSAREAGDVGGAARSAWLKGLVDGSAGDLDAGLDSLLTARDAYSRLRDAPRLAWLENLLGELYAIAGDPRQAWSHRAAALAVEGADAGTRDKILADSASIAVLERRPHTALALLEELGRAGDDRAPWLAAGAAVTRVRAEQLLGVSDLDALAAAMALYRRIEGTGDRRLLLPDLQLARGLLAHDPRVAVHALDRALAGLEATGRRMQEPVVLLARGRAYRRLGSLQLAAADLRRGLAILEGERTGQGASALWMPGVALADELFAEAVGLALQRRDENAAFVLLERGRAQALRSAVASAGPEPAPLTPSQVAARLEPGTTMLVYARTGGERLLWRIDGGGEARRVELPAAAADVERDVALLRADLAAGVWTARTRESAARLHRALLAPARLDSASAPAVRHLVVVPDAGIEQVPFAALVDGGTGRYAVEERSVEATPSIAVFLDARARGRASELPIESALVVGATQPSARLFPGLPALPGAADEAREVSRLYPRGALALDGAATRESLLAGARGRGVLHIASHTLVSEIDPARSALLLSPAAPGDSGALTAAEIARLPLAGTRAVVLAGCETAAGAVGGAEGSLSLARAFLAARVPSVVATLWPLRDRDSAPLVVALHGMLRTGKAPAESLRAAQLQMIHGSDPALRSPATWAAFQAIGG